MNLFHDFYVFINNLNLSLWSLHVGPVFGISLGVRFIGHSTLPVVVSLDGCLSLYGSPAMNWWLVQNVNILSCLLNPDQVSRQVSVGHWWPILTPCGCQLQFTRNNTQLEGNVSANRKLNPPKLYKKNTHHLFSYRVKFASIFFDWIFFVVIININKISSLVLYQKDLKASVGPHFVFHRTTNYVLSCYVLTCSDIEFMVCSVVILKFIEALGKD